MNDLAEWVRYWRAPEAGAEAMHARFTSHAYHRHSHETYSFGVTEAGAQAFSCRHARHVSASGQVMAFNPDDPHDGQSGEHGGFVYRMVHIQPDDFAAVLSAPGAPWPLFRDPVLDDRALFAAVIRLHDALAGPATALARYEALADLARLLRPHAAGAWRPGPSGRAGRSGRSGPSGLSRPSGLSGRAATVGPSLLSGPSGPSARAATVGVAARIRELLHGSPLTDLSADEIAAAAGCSKYAAYRAFTAAYGLTPAQYQRQLRLRSARRLLSAGTPPAVAAADTGFADQAHLTRWFRRCYGVTPAAYRSACSP